MSNRLILIVLFGLSLLFFNSCGRNKITSLTAAGLKDPFLEILKLYKKKNPDTEVDVTFAGSGSLLVKLENHLGDLYIPAAYSYMEEAIKRKLVNPQTVKILAYHEPVLVVKKQFKVASLNELVKANLRLGIADPREAAIGRVTYKILKKADLWKELQPKIVVKTPTVNQLVLYLQSGQIDAAIIWKELVQKLKNVKVIKFPPKLVEKEPIPIGVTTFSKNPKEALKFENFLLKHKEVFKSFGFD